MQLAHPITETFLPLNSAAIRLGVPKSWLKAEAEASRVPVLRTGRRFMFNIELVERALIERAQGNVKTESGEAVHA